MIASGKSVLLSLLLSSLLPSQATASDALLVAIGKLVKITKQPDPCMPPSEKSDYGSEPEFECITLDAVYEATYEIEQVLVGSTPQRSVTFNIADHYGFPSFAEYNYALLFINRGEESWLHKYQGYAVHRTTSDEWASCGNPYDDRAGDEPRDLSEISFARPLTTLGELSAAGASLRFDERYVEIEDGKVFCRKGIYVEQLYSIVREGVLKAREIEAPPLSAGEF